MADISVTLILDDSQFTGKLTQATQKTNEFGDKAKESADKAKKAFEGFGEGLEKAKMGLESIGGLLAGIGIVEFVKSVLEAGQAAVEMGEKFGISTQAMLELNAAAAGTGLSVEKNAQMMGKMLVASQQAADGNLKLRQALIDVGTSTEYLRTHSAEEAYTAQVHALAEMTDKAKAAEIAVQLFGKAGLKVNFKQLAEEQDRFNGTMGDSAASAEEAERVLLGLANKTTEVKMKFLELIEPVLEMITNFGDATTVASALLVVIGGFTIIAGLIALQKAWTMAVEAYAIAQKIANGVLIVFEALLSPVGLAVMAVVAAIVALGVAYERVFGGGKDLVDSFKKLWEDVGKGAGIVVDKMKEMLGVKKDLEKPGEKKPAAPGGPALTDKDVDTQAVAVQNLKNQFELMKLIDERATARLNKEIETVGYSEDLRKSLLGSFDAETKFLQEKLRVQNQIKTLEVEQANGKNVSHGREIAQLKEQLKYIEAQQHANDSLQAKYETAIRIQNIEMGVAKQLNDLEKQRLDLLTTYNEISMTSDEKKLAQIDKIGAAQKKTLQDNMVSTFGKDWETNTAAAEEYNKKIKDITEGVDKLKTQEAENIAKERDGWTALGRDVKQFNEDATNSAKMVDQAFGDFTKGIEDAFVNMAKTGKLSFSSLINTMLEDFLRFEIRMMESEVFKMFAGGDTAGGAGGGLLSGLGKMLGFAGGGDPPVGQPSLVGERGPELFVPKSAGTIIPTNQLGGGGTIHNTTNVYNTISAVDAKSVAQLFAENRQVLFGNVEQARKELPMRSR